MRARWSPARPDNEHADLFATFPNSYGSLGYATRLRIELEPVARHVALRHVRFTDAAALQDAIASISATQRVARRARRRPGRHRLRAGRVLPHPGPVGRRAPTQAPATTPASRSTGQSIQQREIDLLTTYDYLWRWDTDWFWCSRAFGAQNPIVRRLWPRRFKRSDVYHKLVGLDLRFGIADRLDRRAGRPQRERVIQDIEVPVERLGEFLDWFDEDVGMRPVWLCPLRLRGQTSWPTYPLEPGRTYVNVGFWGAVGVGENAPQSPLNRAVEAKVAELDGHKSLYSESFYDLETFDRLYDGPNLAAVKQRYDPDQRLTSLYDKAVRQR